MYSSQFWHLSGNIIIEAIRFQNFHTFVDDELFIQHENTDGQNTTVNASQFLSMGIQEYRIQSGSALRQAILDANANPDGNAKRGVPGTVIGSELEA